MRCIRWWFCCHWHWCTTHMLHATWCTSQYTVHTFAMLRTSQLICTTVLGANRFVVYYHILSCVSTTTLNKHCEKEWVTGIFCIKPNLCVLCFALFWFTVQIDENNEPTFEQEWKIVNCIRWSISSLSLSRNATAFQIRFFTIKAKVNVPFNRLTMRNDIKNPWSE